MKVSEETHRLLRVELILCDSVRDVVDVLNSAMRALLKSTAPIDFQRSMWQDIRRSLPQLLTRPKLFQAMRTKAEEIIDGVLRRTK